jgi:DNA-binding transcriptional LysR family regulator
MDKLRAMTTFVRIVETGSLTAAAERLGTSPTSVVRSLSALERALGVRLLNRTTRRMALTDEGRDYFERCRRLLSEVEDAENALLARQVTPAGRLVITAPVMFGRLHVAPLVIDFLAAFPDVRVELLLVDRIVDLIDEGIDLAIRIGTLPESSLVAIPLGSTRRIVCASPGIQTSYPATAPSASSAKASSRNGHFRKTARPCASRCPTSSPPTTSISPSTPA